MIELDDTAPLELALDRASELDDLTELDDIALLELDDELTTTGIEDELAINEELAALLELDDTSEDDCATALDNTLLRLELSAALDDTDEGASDDELARDELITGELPREDVLATG